MLIKITLKRPNEKESALRVEFMKNGTRYNFYTGKTIKSKNWLHSSQTVGSKEENFKLINDYLDQWKIELKRIIAEMEAKQIRLNKEAIQAELDKAMKKDVPAENKETEITDFISFMSSYIKGKRTRKSEIQKLQQTRKLVILAFNLTTKKRLAEWEALSIKAKSRTELIADFKLKFESINLQFIEKFRDYLYTAQYQTKIKDVEVMQNYKVNYIDKQVKGLKQFLLAAIDAKLVEHFTWNSIQSEEIEVDSVYTDFDEIQSLYDTHFTSNTDILVRDKYVLNCFLGLRYSDLNKLEPHLFSKKQISGENYVIYCGRAQKTDRRVEFALHPTAIQILEKYNYKMPKLNRSEFNERIKNVALKAGLTTLQRIREIRGYDKIERDVPKYELISSHAGRRSFCTNFYVQGVSVPAIMSVSGHSTEKEFRKYIKQSSVRLEVVAQQVMAIQGITTKLRIA